MNLSLSRKFVSLVGPFSSSDITGIYFASNWCPDCTPITPLLKKAYEDQHPDGKFQVVYVSSDRDEEEMMKTFNTAHASWNCVPFDSADRNGLKRHFGACAGKEVRELGLAQGERKYGIPTLIIIDSKSEEVLSYEGVKHLVQGDLLQQFGIGTK